MRKTESSLSERFIRRAERVADLLKNALRGGRLRAPLTAEREPSFVASVIAPVVKSVLADLNVSGLVCGGEGLAPVAPVYFLGVQYRPDIVVMSYRERVFAMEVKFIKKAPFSAQAALAIGQAELYRRSGFVNACALIIDVENVLALSDIVHAGQVFQPNNGTDLLLLRNHRGVLVD